MKKSLVALASLAAASAFAGVSITGTFDPSINMEDTTYQNGNSVSQNYVRNNTQGTSNVTFSGSEDLGGGLKAMFLVENDFDSSKNTGIVGGGQQYLGLSGGFGTLQLGAANTPSLSTLSAATGFGTKIGGGFGFLSTSRVRNSNSVVYSSPSFSNVTVKVAHVFKTNADTNAATAVTEVGSVTDTGVFYANGPLSVGYSLYKISAISGGDSTKQNNLAVTYNLGMASVGFGSYSESKGTATDSKANNLSVTVPMGNLSLIVNTGSKDDTTTANKDRKINAVGVKYAMSKNTSMYARFVNQKFDNMTADSDVTQIKSTLVGMQTNF
jgi:predicted porin